MNAVLQRLSDWTGQWNPYDPSTLPRKGQGLDPVIVEESHVHRHLVWTCVVGFVAFLIWAVVAPLDAGVVLSGSVIVSGNRKAVQHPSGGVVQTLLVKEGARVKEGDVLISLNALNADANLTSAELQYINLLASESRLLAERAGTDIRWKPELNQFGPADTRALEAKLMQQQLYRSRKSEIEGQLRQLNDQLTGQLAQAKSLEMMLAEKRSQLQLLEPEARSTVQLAKEGYMPLIKANEVLRTQSGLQSDLANIAAQISSNQATVLATREQVALVRNNFLKGVDADLSDLQKNRDAYLTRMAAYKFDRNLTEVRAPATGTVVGLKVYTVGGVITPSQVLMEIVPDGGHLIVEAQVPTVSIDKVRNGLTAELRFSAFDQRTTPVVPGAVNLVGADKLKDERGNEYYLAQVETTEESQKMLGAHHIQPGMPVEVIVKTGERTFMNYLMKPLSDSFARSFRGD